MTHTACNHEIKRLENEITRLRAANAELVEALKKISSRYDAMKAVCECALDAYDMHCLAAQALSRAEQAKPEPETCVWTVSENGVWIQHGCTGAQMLKGHLFIRPETCPYCKKKLIIEQAGKSEGRQG